MKKAVILASGGLDSSTVLAMIAKQDYEIYALSFNYSQNHLIEIEKIVFKIKKAQAIITNEFINRKYEFLSISFLKISMVKGLLNSILQLLQGLKDTIYRM